MPGNIIALIVLLALAIFFGWLVTRAWRLTRWILKWPALILSGLLTLVFAAFFALTLIGLYEVSAPQTNPVSDVKVAGTPEQIARGNRIVFLCAGCHSSADSPPLDGGTQSRNGPLGSIYPPNLTPAGELKGWTDGEIMRAFREGVHKSGRALYGMPVEAYHHLSDADAQAVVAYLRSQPPVPHMPQVDTPSNGMNILGLIAVGIGAFPSSAQPAITQPVKAPPLGTAGYGQYLVSVVGCRTCHGPELGGGKASPFGGPPVGPNLTVIVPKWNEADFVKTIRTGVDPGGHTLAVTMPWKEISGFTSDDDLKSLYIYLHGLKPAG